MQRVRRELWVDKIKTDLPIGCEDQLKALFKEYEYVGTESIERVGFTQQTQHEIVLNTNDPKSCAPQRLSPQQAEAVWKQIETLLRIGKIRRSKSPYASRLVLVKKSDRKTRLCVDYRRINLIMTPDAFPLLKIDDVVKPMGGSGYFTKIHVKSGFWQILLHEESRAKTGFVSSWILFEFIVMPFGLRNLPATFQRLVNEILAKEIREGFAVVYMDDILIYSDNWQLHLEKGEY